MRLTELELKHFGKFYHRTIRLQPGIHLISGENEAGKSTVCAFLKAMLFGLERGRGRAAGKDEFSRFEPWEEGNFYAGTLRFTCNGKQFCLQRNFDKYSKSTSLVCETDGEELSVEDGDLTVLLGGLTRGSYENTLCIGQLMAAPGPELAAEVRNYATGYYVTGDSELDVSAAREAVAAKRKETDRRIRELLQEQQRQRESTEQEAGYIWRELHQMDGELEEIDRELARREAEKPRKQSQEWTQSQAPENRRLSGRRVHPLEVIGLLTVIAIAFWFLPEPWNACITVVLALLSIIYVWNRMKIGKHTDSESVRDLEEASGEELISTEKLIWKQEHLRQERQEKQVEYENLQERLREMDDLGADYAEADRKRRALALAAERMDALAEELQREVAEQLNVRASGILSELTEGRYDRLTADAALRLSVLQGGRRIPVERLSRGTLEQIYFSLRMAVAEILYEEELPVILDDAFAFYDDRRLERALVWLGKTGRQVLIFSCQGREEELMKKAGIPYAKTVL